MSQTELVGPDELLVPEDVQLLSWLCPVCCLAGASHRLQCSVSSEPRPPPHTEFPCTGREGLLLSTCCLLPMGAASRV